MKKRTNRLLALLALTMVMCLFALPALAREMVTERVSLDDVEWLENDELAAYHVDSAFYGGFSTFGWMAGDNLSGTNKALYDELKAAFENIASGSTTSTTVSFAQDEYVYTYSAASMEAAKNLLGADISKVVHALLSDCAFDLYWFDKTEGYLQSYYTYDNGDGTYTFKLARMFFLVAKPYQAAGYDVNNPAVHADKAGANAAAANARDIVTAAASMSDYEKLIYYRDQICALTDYNDAAAEDNYQGGYGDPWQMVYVFDGDPATKVVCEGYSKAFQYLCDQTNFKGDIICYTVNGMMAGGSGAGRHMWNIVTMEDGKNYLVDVTNSDEGTVGQAGGLFLAGTSGSVESGYVFTIDALNSVSFAYGSEATGSYTTQELTIAGSSYEPNTHTHSFTGKVTYETNSSSEHNKITQCTGCDEKETVTEVHTIKYTQSTDGLTHAAVCTANCGYSESAPHAFGANGQCVCGAKQVARVDSAIYADIGAALSAWANGGTALTLLSDAAYAVEEGEIYLASGERTLNLGSFTLDLGTAYIDNYGTLTITGGTITNDTNFPVVSHGSLTANGSKFIGCLVTNEFGDGNAYDAQLTGCQLTHLTMWPGGTVKLKMCTLDDAYIDYRGGGLIVEDDCCEGWQIRNFGDAVSVADAFVLPTDYYLFDDHGKVVDTVPANRIRTIKKHTSADHVAEYAADEDTNTITASCSMCGEDMGKATIMAPADLIYDGTAKAAVVTNTIAGEDYTLRYMKDGSEAAPVDAGIYYATLSVGDVSVSMDFAINRAPIIGAVITAADQVYTGSPFTPDVAVTWNNMTLLPDRDYTYTYTDNTNVGTAKILITGIGNFTGEATGTFNILMSGSALSAQADQDAYTYGDTITVTATMTATGKPASASTFGLMRNAQLPTMALYVGDTKLTGDVAANESGEFVMTYDTAKKGLPVGTSSLTVRYSGDANTAAEQTIVELMLNAKTLTPALTGAAEKIYDGTTAVVDSGLSITLSGVVGSDAVSVSGQYAYADAGAGPGKTVTATGLTLAGADAIFYKLAADEASANIGTINKAVLTAADFVFTAPENLTYDGNAKAASFTTEKTGVGEIMVKYSTDPVNAGSYTVSVDVTEGANYQAASLTDGSWAFAIAPKTVVNPTFSGLAQVYPYTGSEVKPEFTLMDGDTVIPAEEYTVFYDNNVNEGLAAITVFDQESGNYIVSGAVQFRISKHVHEWTYAADQENLSIVATCSGAIGVCPNETITYKLVLPQGVTYADSAAAKQAAWQITPENADGAVSMECTYSILSGNAILENGTPMNAGDYEVSSIRDGAMIMATMTIAPAQLPEVSLEPASAVYTGTQHKPTITVKGTVGDKEYTLVEDTDFAVTWPGDMVNVGTKSIVLTGMGNYTGTAKPLYTIERADLTAADFVFAAPENLIYDGSAKAASVTTEKTGVGEITIKYDADPVNVGEYKVSIDVAQGSNYNAATGLTDAAWTFAITTSGSAIAAETDKQEYTYGDAITVTAKAAATGEAPKGTVFGLLRAAQPSMALYYGDTNLTDDVAANESGEFVMTYDTAKKLLPVGTSNLTVHYSGDANTAAENVAVAVTLSEKELTAVLDGAAEKTYDGTTAVTDSGLSITLNGVVGSDTVSASGQYAYADANAGTGKAVTASGLTLDGQGDEKFYKLAASEITANVGTITKAALQVSGSGTASGAFGSELTVSGLNVTLVGGMGVSGTWTVPGGDQLPVGQTSATAAFTPDGGADNYILPLEAEVALNITAKPMDTAPVTLAPDTFIYDGTEKKPTVEVKDGEVTLTEGTDYDVVYPQDMTNAGGKAVEVIFKGNYSGKATTAYAIMPADAEFVSGGVFNGTQMTTDFTYGDTITVKAVPGVERHAVMSLRPMTKNQMALFVGDTQISEAVEADEFGVYTMTYNTADKALAVGSNALTVKFAGNDNLLAYSVTGTINLAPKALTITSVTAKDRIYNSDMFTVLVESAVFDGKVLESDDVNLAQNIVGTLESDAIGTYTKVTLPETIALTGEHAAYYTAVGGAEAATQVSITDVPANLATRVEVIEGIREIPQELAAAGFDTAEKISLQLKTVIKELEPDVAGTVLYDAILMYSEDGGTTWIEADKVHFPASGLLHVLLPIPKGSDPEKHLYFVTHMFTMDAYGHKPGETETPDVEVVLGADGTPYLSFYVTGLSPIMVGWSDKEVPVSLPQTGDSSNIAVWLALLGLACVSLTLLRKRAHN